MVGENGWIKVTRGNIEYSSPELRGMTVPAGAFDIPGKKDGHQDNFIDAVVNHTAPRAPARHGYFTVMVAHQANAAMRAGISELLWDPVAERVTNSADAERFMAANYRGPWSLTDAAAPL